MTKPTKVLVVDDSALMRLIVSDILASDDRIEVIGSAHDGREAIEKVKSLSPDVVTMDIEMPELNGIEALRVIMREAPTRVVMLSGAVRPGLAYEALRLGAVDFVGKPSGPVSHKLKDIGHELLRKVHAARRANLKNLAVASKAHINVTQLERTASVFAKVVAIGSSTGGPQALERVFRSLGPNFPAAILIVQHLPEGYSQVLAEHLSSVGHVQVTEAVDGEQIKLGRALLAPGGRHMVVNRGPEGGYVVNLEMGPRVNQVRPSVDKLMLSIAETYGKRSIGVILSGMGSDGAVGMGAIKQAGGSTIVQDEETSVVFGMPKAVVERELADRVVPIDSVGPSVFEALTRTGRSSEHVSV